MSELNQLIQIFQNISYTLAHPGYKFWVPCVLSGINLFVLSATLIYLFKYTKATERMKDEIIKQNKLVDASNIFFKMVLDYDKDFNFCTQRTFGQLIIDTKIHNISRFRFLDKDDSEIGWHGLFLPYKDESMVNYNFGESGESGDNANKNKLKFIEAIKINKGKITAKVSTTNGNLFLYTLETVNNYWKEDKGQDTFLTIKKTIL